MKKIYLALFACVAFLGVKATTYTVSVVGTSYSPNTLTISIGDMVTFTNMSSSHPTAQVDGTTWAANGTNTLSSGWGVKTSNFTYTATTTGTVYYVCQVHVGLGMKGQIVVSSVGINEAMNILQNISLFPNPAQENVKLSFSLKNASEVSVKLFNLLGQEVSQLATPASLPQGNYNYSFELPALQNGTYFVEIVADNKRSLKKLVINK